MNGQERRAWLEDLIARYVVPAVPPEMRGQVAAVNSAMNPVQQIGDSMAAGRRMAETGLSMPQRVEAAGNMLSGVAGVVAPAVAASRVGGQAANALAEGLAGMTAPQRNALADFGTDEFGGVNLNGQTWFHGTPDARAVKAEGFTGNRAVYMTDNPGIARTYADPKRAWDYQGAEPEVLRLRSEPQRVADINVRGDTFKGINADYVAEALRSAGIPEDQIAAALSDGRRVRSDGRINTANLESVLKSFGFDAADIKNVRDTYMNAEKAPRSTVRMVLDPSLVTILKKYGALPAAFGGALAASPDQAQAGGVVLTGQPPEPGRLSFGQVVGAPAVASGPVGPLAALSHGTNALARFLFDQMPEMPGPMTPPQPVQKPNGSWGW